MVKIVSVQFKSGGKTYYFAPGKDKYEKGMGVVVETAKGLEYATVVLPEGEIDESEVVSPLKPVVRVATKKDEEQVKRNEERKDGALKTAQEKIEARGLEMKLVDCEFAFDGSKVTFFFTAESRVDFRELIKDLSSAFHMRIELRQINIREEIKMMGGFGPCGRECCCVGCMPEPKKVSVKMAKNQGLSLNPGKISGYCGRLMCCLSYENEFYAEACKKVPKIGSEIDTPDGRGIVVNVNMLKMEIKVKIEDKDMFTYHDFKLDDLELKRIESKARKEEDDDDEELAPEPAEKEAASRPDRRAQSPREEGEGKGKNRKNRHRNKNKGNKGEGGEQQAKEGRDNREPRERGDNPNRGKGERPAEPRHERGEGRPPKERRERPAGSNGGNSSQQPAPANPNSQGGQGQHHGHRNRNRNKNRHFAKPENNG